MDFKKINIKTFFVAGIVTLTVILSAFYLPANDLHPLEAINSHYKKISYLSEKSNPSRALLDSIKYPWSEYSSSALTGALMRTYYLDANQERKLTRIVTCPENSSDQTKADLEYLLDLQNKRTPGQVERAAKIGEIGSWPNIINPADPLYEENMRQLFYIATPVGEWFNPGNFPVTTQLLRNTIQDIRVTEFRMKQHFKRPRPYHLEHKLNPVMRIKSPSFASGHSLWAFTQAFLFSEIFPEKRSEFIAMAEEVRWSREILGIHYPTDNEAARIISWNLLNLWMKNAQFRKDLEKAKEEWKLKSKQFQ